MKKILPLIFIIGFVGLLIYASTPPAKPAQEKIGYGEFKDGVFTHEYFNMSIELPTDWVMRSREAQKEFLQKGGKILLKDHPPEKLQKLLWNTCEQQAVSLFILSKHKSNPIIMCLAERMPLRARVKRGSDYHALARKKLELSKTPFEIDDNIVTETISGVPFDIMIRRLNSPFVTVEQKFYATKIKDYVLVFILTYTNEEDEKQLKEILNTLKFSAT